MGQRTSLVWGGGGCTPVGVAHGHPSLVGGGSHNGVGLISEGGLGVGGTLPLTGVGVGLELLEVKLGGGVWGALFS